MSFDDDLRKRMALAKQQGWSDQEIQRSAMIERATNYNKSRQQQTQAQQSKGAGRAGGLKGFALDLTPFGRVAEKLINHNAGDITAGEVGTELALTALPFGLGKIAKGAKVAKAAITGVKAAEDASRGTKLLRGMSTKSTIAPTSTLESATEQNRLIDLARNTPALRGSAARKFQHVDGVVGQLADNVDELFKGVDATVPSRQFNKGVTQVRKDIVDTNERKRFDIELSRVVGKTFDGQLPDKLSATDINTLRRGVNAQMSGIYTKIQKGTQLTDKDNAMLQLKAHLDGQLEQIAPEAIRGQVKQNNLDMNTLIKGRGEFKKASESQKGPQFLGTSVNSIPGVSRVVQGSADVAGRALAKKPTQVALQQGGVRVGAETLGLRNPFKPDAPFDPNSMPTMFENPQTPEEAILRGLTIDGGPTDFEAMAAAFDQNQNSMGTDGGGDPNATGMPTAQDLMAAAVNATMAGDFKAADQYAQMAKAMTDMGGGGGSAGANGMGNVGKVSAQNFNLAQDGASSIQQMMAALQKDPSLATRTSIPGQGLPVVGGYVSAAAGTNDYQSLAYSIADKYLKLTTGATATESEIRNTVGKLMPRAGDNPQQAQAKIQRMNDFFTRYLQTAGITGTGNDPQDELAMLGLGGGQQQYAYGY
jgi:hypothetical protein